MKVRLLRDLYRYIDGVYTVFAKEGDILETGPISKDRDWLVGCHVVRLIEPLDGGGIADLAFGIDCEKVK